MKILKVEFENINSYKGHYCIDFTDDIFRKNHNQFVISGVTASGKTTILDVITLALYGSTPRQGKITSGKFEVMNKESDSCMAAITYSCDKGTIYSEFKQRRLKNSDIKCLIYNLDTNKKIPVTAAGDLISVTESNINLTYDQFVRSILIPQGAFDKFLGSNEKEKSEILARVSRTEIYRDIGSILLKKAKFTNDEYAKRMEIRNSIDIMTEEAEEGQKKEKAALEKEVRDKQKRSGELRNQIVWREKFDAAGTKIGDAGEKLKQAEEKEKNFTEKKKIIEKAEKAEKCNKAYTKLQELRRNIKNENEKITGADTKLKETKAELDKALSNANGEKDKLKDLQDKEEELTVLWKQVQDLDSGIAAEERLLIEKKKSYESAKKELGDKEKLLKEHTQRITDLTKKNAGLKKYLSENEKDSGIGNILPVLNEKKKNLDRAAGEKNKVQGELGVKEPLEKEKAEEVEKLRKREAELKETLFNMVDENHVVIAGILRGKLEAGKACPVCGAEYHPAGVYHEELSEGSVQVAADVSMISEELESVKEDLGKTEDAEKELTRDITNAREAKGKFEKEENDILAEINKELEPWETELSSGTSEYTASFNEIIDKLTKLKKTYEDKTSELTEGEAKISESGTIIAGLNIDRIKETLDDSQKSYEDQSAILEKARKDRKALFGDKVLDKEKEQYRKSLKDQREVMEKAQKKADSYNNEYISQNTKKKAAEERIETLQPERDEAEKVFIQQFADNGFVSEEDFLGCVMSEEDISALKDEEEKLKEEKTSAKTTYDNAIEEYESLKKDADYTEARKEELKAEQEELEAETGVLQGKIGELKKGLEVNKDNKEKVVKIDQELEPIAKEKKIYEDIKIMIKGNDGADFQVYVQKLAMQNLIIKANVFMKTLQPDKELYVKEDTMDIKIREGEGEDMVERPVSNASGGETFCISLALALAMAEFASENGGVEALFLDEGFGTLSGEPLNEAIQSLKQLQRTGKLLGIITHVDNVISEFPIVVKASKSKRRSTLSGPGVKRMEPCGK